MGSFGENLRRERELRGITLPELSEATKISPRYLRALESNRFEQLPGGVYNHGFVRAVARYLKVDERHWVAEFARAAHESPEILAHYAPLPPPASSSHRGLWSFLVLVAAFGVAAYILEDIRAQRAAEAAQAAKPAPVSSAAAASPATVSQPSAEGAAPDGTLRRATTKPTPPSQHPSRPAGESRAAEPATSSEAPTEVAASDPGSQLPAAVGNLRLQIDVMDDAWVNVRVDGRQVYAGTMKPRESRSFRAGRQIELITANASAVVLTLNGQTLAPLGYPGERKRIVLTAKDVRPPSP